MTFYDLAKAVTYGLVRLLFSVRYEGLENIPRDQGFIVCANHQSNFDPLFFAHKIKQPIHFMAKAEFFDNFFLKRLFRSLNAFPVNRGKGDMSAIETAADIVDGGGVLAIFPEGTRSKDGNPQRPRSGVALVAGKVGCGVLPVGISFKGKLRFRKRVTVRYGKLIPNGELGVDISAPRTMRRAAGKVMDAIIANMDPACYGEGAAK